MFPYLPIKRTSFYVVGKSHCDLPTREIAHGLESGNVFSVFHRASDRPNRFVTSCRINHAKGRTHINFYFEADNGKLEKNAFSVSFRSVQLHNLLKASPPPRTRGIGCCFFILLLKHDANTIKPVKSPKYHKSKYYRYLGTINLATICT